MRVLILFCGVALALYLVVLTGFFFTQRSLLYYPVRNYVPLAETGANRAFTEISVRTADGIDLKGWYAPATSKRFTIVFFHGNADSLRTAAQIADPYIASGFGFLLTEYRGYSGLPGTPSETGLYSDGRAFIADLLARGIPVGHIILFGHSLGTGVAIEMSQEFRVGGLMLLAPYLSIPKVAAKHLPLIPVSLLALDRFDNAKKIQFVHTPVLIANGSEDQIVPPSQGRALYTSANAPKEIHTFPNRGHNDLFDDFVPVSLEWIDHLPPADR